jgi:hypothetical protein
LRAEVAIKIFVGLCGGGEHGLGHLGEFFALIRRGALRSQARHQPLQFAPHLEQPQLQPQIDLGNHDAAPRHDHDKPVTRQALQRLPDRGATDLEAHRQRLFRQHRCRRQLQGDDHLFEFAIGPIGQRTVFAIHSARSAFPRCFRLQMVSSYRPWKATNARAFMSNPSIYFPYIMKPRGRAGRNI